MEPQDQQTSPTPEPSTPTTAPTSTPPTTSPEPSKSTKGYGKRPVWQWVLVYVVLAIIVYGLIYLLFMRKSGTGGSKGYGY